MAEAYKIRQKDHQLFCTYVYYIYIYLHAYTHTHRSQWADGRKESEVGRCFLSCSKYDISEATDQQLVATLFTICRVCGVGSVCVYVCMYTYTHTHTHTQ